MAKKTPNGRNDYENEEWSLNALQDALRGRSAQGSIPAAYQSVYTQAYNNGVYLRGIMGVTRNTI